MAHRTPGRGGSLAMGSRLCGSVRATLARSRGGGASAGFARGEDEVARAERASVLGVEHELRDRRAGFGVHEGARELAGPEAGLLAPLPERREHDVELLAARGQDVAVVRRGLAR